MIYDKIENIDRYFAVSENFKSGLLLASKLLSDKYEAKRYECSNDVYAFESEYKPSGDDSSVFENHREKIDIQLLYEGNEDLDMCSSAEVTDEYSLDKDCEFGKSDKFVAVHLTRGYFVALFPGEWHRPGKKNAFSTRVKKIVVKVKS